MSICEIGTVELFSGMYNSTKNNKGSIMNTEHLNEFIYLANCLNFRRTADHFYVSRSVISRHIHALEESLGTVLFERTAQGIKLTEAGNVFLQDAQTVLRDWDLACARVQAVSGTSDKLVRVGYLRNAARPFLPDFVKSMALHHPEIHLTLLCMEYHEARQAIQDGAIDIAIGLNVAKAISRNYRSTFIYDDHFVVVCSHSHPLAKKGGGVSFEELRDQKCLVPDSYVAASLTSVANDLIDEGTLAESEKAYEDMDLLYLKVQTEECVAFVSGLNAAMFEDSLTVLPIEGDDTGFSVSAYYHDDFSGTPYEFCKEEFEACRKRLEGGLPAIPHWR